MANTSQHRALANYRKRIRQRGLARFEVLGRETDRDLIRSLARELASDTPDSARIRETITSAVQREPRKRGGVLDALRRSPLVGAELDLTRPRIAERKIAL